MKQSSSPTPAPITDELERVNVLKNYKILDTAAEQAFDRLTDLASTFYQSPIALISLVDEERQWFKSRVGLDATETPRDISFCQHAIKSDAPFIVQDARNDERFKDNPLVTDGPKIRFYAGAPLKSPTGHRIGTLCVIDPEPRDKFGLNDSKQLQLLADIVISEMELRLHNAKLTSALRSQSDFLSMVSHEIRNPLGAIIGLSDALNNGSFNPEQTKKVKGIQSSSRVLMGLLNDVLDFTKSKAGKIQLNISATDLSTLFNTFKETWSEAAADKSLSFHVNIDNNLPQIARLDELRVNQILNNVVSNAIKFTSDGSITTNIGTQEDVISGLSLTITISDTGIGMTADELERLFDPFEQADKSISKRFGGTGLGMSITKDLVELMAGRIECKSQTGVGSEFHISIPIELPKKSGELSSQSQHKKILVVDDIDMNLMVIEGLIEKLGHHAVTANSGQTAIDKALSEDFDLILMDIHMPEIDGLEAAQQIRSKKPNQKIIALSADDPQSLPESQKNSHIDGFLLKPMSEQSLSEVIDQQ